jgi:hypothetical protein
MLICTLLTFAMCADPSVQAAIVVGDITAPIVWSRRDTRSCMELGRQPIGGPGDALIELSSGGPNVSGRRAGVSISNARIEMTAYRWPKMNPADADALRRQYRASLWHEIGHIVTARDSIAAVNDAGLAGEPAFARIKRDQDDYDAASMHGVQQSTLASPLAGEDTVIVCSPR